MLSENFTPWAIAHPVNQALDLDHTLPKLIGTAGRYLDISVKEEGR